MGGMNNKMIVNIFGLGLDTLAVLVKELLKYDALYVIYYIIYYITNVI